MAGLNRRNIEIFRGFEPDAQRRHRVKYAIYGWALASATACRSIVSVSQRLSAVQTTLAFNLSGCHSRLVYDSPNIWLATICNYIYFSV